MPICVITDPGTEHERKCFLNMPQGKTRCKQCDFRKPNGEQCRLRTCQDHKYCWMHLVKKHKVRIAPSELWLQYDREQRCKHCKHRGPFEGKLCARHFRQEHPDWPRNEPFPKGFRLPGKGLFATQSIRRSAEEKKRLVFDKGEVIGIYLGSIRDKEEVDARYDIPGQVERIAPYAFQTNNGVIYDALCVRNFMGYANDAHNNAQGLRANAEVREEPRGAVVYARRKIYEGEEILFNYGRSYWTGNHPIVPFVEKRCAVGGCRRKRKTKK